jgi:hypothetical protein
MQESILTSEQYRNLSKEIINSVDRRFRIVPMNSLKHPKYHLKAPIYVNLEYEDEQVIASFDDIEAFAYAETESEAINQLSEEIINMYADLQEFQDKLGPLPNKWWQYLKEIIECR